MTGIFARLLHATRKNFPQTPGLRRFSEGKWTRPHLPMPSLSLSWIKRHEPGFLGWPGLLGIGLLSICPALYISAILPMQEKLASIQSSVITLQERMKYGGHDGPGIGQRTPEEQLDEFYRMFPESGNMPAYLEKVFSLAQEQGIRLYQGEYKATRDKEGSLVSFQMTFPVTGEYPQIRKYLASLLADIPVLSLQQVQFKRQGVGNSLVEANIRLGLYFLEQKP